MINEYENKKIYIEIPYNIGTIIEKKVDKNITAKICEYRITFEKYRQIIKIGIKYNIYETNNIVDQEITLEELRAFWKKKSFLIEEINEKKYLELKEKIQNNEQIPKKEKQKVKK